MIVCEEAGDIFKADVQAIVCPVNCVGTMGNGLALAFAHRFKGLLKDYQRACRKGVLSATGYFIWEVPPEQGSAFTHVVCVATKKHWKYRSDTRIIDKSLSHLCKDELFQSFKSVAFPALGCGKGLLEWPIVRPVMYHHLEDALPSVFLLVDL